LTNSRQDQADDVPESTTAPPGLSQKAVKFVTNDGKAVWTSEIATIKPIKVSCFTITGLFNKKLHYMYLSKFYRYS